MPTPDLGVNDHNRSWHMSHVHFRGVSQGKMIRSHRKSTACLRSWMLINLREGEPRLDTTTSNKVLPVRESDIGTEGEESDIKTGDKRAISD